MIKALNKKDKNKQKENNYSLICRHKIKEHESGKKKIVLYLSFYIFSKIPTNNKFQFDGEVLSTLKDSTKLHPGIGYQK